MNGEPLVRSGTTDGRDERHTDASNERRDGRGRAGREAAPVQLEFTHELLAYFPKNLAPSITPHLQFENKLVQPSSSSCCSQGNEISGTLGPRCPGGEMRVPPYSNRIFCHASSVLLS